MTFKRIINLIFLHIQSLPMPSRGIRPKLAKLGGVNVICPDKTFIGEGVWFDSLYPEEIEIDEKAVITVGCTIFTHFVKFDGDKHYYEKGKVHIGKNTWIGARTIICQNVTIGDNSVIGAGSVVTKNIPKNEVWAGNPAKFIKKRSGF